MKVIFNSSPHNFMLYLFVLYERRASTLKYTCCKVDDWMAFFSLQFSTDFHRWRFIGDIRPVSDNSFRRDGDTGSWLTVGGVGDDTYPGCIMCQVARGEGQFFTQHTLDNTERSAITRLNTNKYKMSLDKDFSEYTQ